MNIRHGKKDFFVAVLLCTLILFSTPTLAETLQSNNFKIDESSVGTSGPLNAGSLNYGITDATGDLGVGNSASSSFQIEAGSKTSPDPVLAFAVTSSTANFGSFSTSSASVATATFSVLNYTSYGYVAQIVGYPPTNGSHTIPGMSVSGPSQPGTEQFGINLVANTLPVSLGANPDNGLFGFGSIKTDYATPNTYRYVSGETIAEAPKSSGITNYTISYIVNVGGLTPGGIYTSDQTLIVTGTY